MSTYIFICLTLLIFFVHRDAGSPIEPNTSASMETRTTQKSVTSLFLYISINHLYTIENNFESLCNHFHTRDSGRNGQNSCLTKMSLFQPSILLKIARKRFNVTLEEANSLTEDQVNLLLAVSDF